ncbi:MAG: ATP synthase F0 subunit C [Lachnospiraceae bacterium]|nr:ATP synthase F0 subunit C [Lachnospiraceae bacterium]MBQ3968210.1 ATP synthase F0 subunit C [Lachnospiraceae bacterium]MBR4587073.1 ATP synthase F0 subunit C [Lachnospiraceae bacterium]MCR4927687.1 ATP synthase F0 subunit C [Lachnospiraceae bacterium]
MCTAAFADGETEAAAEADATITVVDQVSSAKAWSAGISIGIVAAAGAVAMAITIATAIKGIARQPEADGKIRTSMMLGLVFIETAIIYALIVAILIIFVL